MGDYTRMTKWPICVATGIEENKKKNKKERDTEIFNQMHNLGITADCLLVIKGKNILTPRRNIVTERETWANKYMEISMINVQHFFYISGQSLTGMSAMN